MNGERDLRRLLRTMQPRLHTGSYVFITIAEDQPLPPAEDVIGSFREAEGMSLIVDERLALQMGWGYDFVAAWITLEVHSALAAVGLTAAVAAVLTAADISCNVVAATHHDHLFVAVEHGPRALTLLNDLADHYT